MKLKMKQQQQISGSLPKSPISRQIKFHEYKGPPQAKRQHQQQQQQQANNANKSQMSQIKLNSQGHLVHKPHSSKLQASGAISSTNSNKWPASDPPPAKRPPSQPLANQAASAHFRDQAACRLASMGPQSQLQFHPSQPQGQLQLNNSQTSALLVANLGGQPFVDHGQGQSHQHQHQHQQQQQQQLPLHQQRLLTLSQAPAFIQSLYPAAGQSLGAAACARAAQRQPMQSHYQNQAQSQAQPSEPSGLQSEASSQWLPMQQLTMNTSPSSIEPIGQSQIQLHTELLLLAAQTTNQSHAHANHHPFTNHHQHNHHHHHHQQQQQQQQQENQLTGSEDGATDSWSTDAHEQATHDHQASCQMMDINLAIHEPMALSLGEDIADSLGQDSDSELIDACDTIEPSIGAFGGEVDDELLFSEFIDLQDVPMNVDESDWLRKFLPPCSMGQL